ncbi:MAG: M48 family metallopeptidase [Bacteroidetes bacterium]|nr:M48 family metallopeptidase [Bacteroidota bacterium]
MEYTVHYSSRRKNIRITIERDRSVIVYAPEGTSEAMIERAVIGQRTTILRRINHPQKYPSPRPVSEFISGESLLFLGRTYPLTVTREPIEGVRFDEHFYISQAKQQQANELLRNWYQQQAREWLTPRIELYANRLGVEYKKIRVTNLRFRWGSCTSQNNLHFNWRLIKAPMRVVEYIIVHELAHLLEPNHTPAFWNIIAVQLPDYEKAKGWLKLYGHLLEVDF